jgi:type II secretory pathway component GspD/PulD (secretin)
MTILLEKARLAYVVENNVVKVTTAKRSKGRLVTKVFHVMDLVTPIPEYGLSPHHTLAGALANQRNLPELPGNRGATPFIPQSGMREGTLVSGGGLPGGVPNVTGTLQNTNENRGQLAMSPQRGAYSQQLMKLVTGMVRPYSWSELGGNGNLSYYDIGGALVVNQTADVIGEVQQLLDSLRRLQDLSVSVEIRVVSLSEAFFERVGVDFSMNIKTNNTTLEREFATSQFRPQPFLNDINSRGTVGWSPATSFTSDLDVPIRPSSFGLSLPPFGGYQPALGPTTNGGLSLGLAFLNDIQVYMFLEAAQGNRRVNIMQAPKITLFNGQTSTVFVGDLAFFTTGLQVLNVGGQFVYLPQNTAVPIGQGFNPNGTGGSTQGGVSVTVQAVISSDRRFVRLNLTPTLTALASANVPLFPITTFVTPVFEGGSQGQPIPFTQFYQQPSFTEISAQTTVAVPDGGTVLLGGLKTLAQGRNEFGPPVLAQVPYLNRLFKNIGIGTETRHVMLMVTPRIIINSEEELRQTSEGGITNQ